jgi:carboxynorspermidine decarboxylase
LIDESLLLKNLKKIQLLKSLSNIKIVLALKCFSTWSVFDLIKEYVDGTTSSSVFEVKLGFEKIGKETHSYCVAYSNKDIQEVKKFSSKIIFNSISQLKKYYKQVSDLNVGLRINPLISYSEFYLADPAQKYSRLGESNIRKIDKIKDLINGVMIHFNCDNDDFDNFNQMISNIKKQYGHLFSELDWVSFGGGVLFTNDDYPLQDFAKLLKSFSEEFNIQVYLEPGEAVVTRCAKLVTSVVDIVNNELDIAIIDASIESHMLDLLTYDVTPKINFSHGKYEYVIAGRSCLAGDIFGTYRIDKKLQIGDEIHILDAAGYTMVKKNWFNGLQMPSIVVKRLDNSIEMIKQFNYFDFVNSLS